MAYQYNVWNTGGRYNGQVSSYCGCFSAPDHGSTDTELYRNEGEQPIAAKNHRAPVQS